MSGLLGKVADQLSGQKSSQPSSGSSGLMHKVTDSAITGQRHPQDLQKNPQVDGNNAAGSLYLSPGEFFMKSHSPYAHANELGTDS